MAVSKRRIDLNCAICNQPLTSTQTALTEEVLSLLAEQNVIRKNVTDAEEYKRNANIHKDQVVATKCGHMFHMGCLRTHVKTGIDKKGAVFCPICTRPVSLQRVWPVLIPPTPLQAVKIKKLAEMKEQNETILEDLKEIRQRMHMRQAELKQIESETSQCLEDIQEKQKQLDEMEGPTDQELEELRKIQRKRQSIVRVVTKHNSELLELLMHETNVEVSQIDVTDLDRIYNENRDRSSNIVPKIPVSLPPPRVNPKPLPRPSIPNPNTNYYNSEIMSQQSYGRTPVTNFGNLTESFQEVNAGSSDTFSSDRSGDELNNNNNKRLVPPWKPKPARDRDRYPNPQRPSRVVKEVVFDYGQGYSNNQIETRSSLSRLARAQDSISIALARRDGTRDIAPKKSRHKNNFSKKKLPPMPTLRPKWCR